VADTQTFFYKECKNKYKENERFLPLLANNLTMVRERITCNILTFFFPLGTSFNKTAIIKCANKSFALSRS